jgi:CRP/FNR family transcriptional regulator, anaerobic regulatory protein
MPLEAPATADDAASRQRSRLHRIETRKPGTQSGEATTPDAPREVGQETGQEAGQETWQGAFPLQSERQITRARHTLYRAGDELGGIPFVYSGWAARVRRLSDGRRQILSFVLPGDLVSASAIFADRLSFFVEAITDVRYSISRRAQVDEILARDPQLVRTLVSACLAEQAEVEELATDLGRRRAEERIARLFLQLRTRLAARGQISGLSFDLPLRQQHIADATGMTVIHVGRVLGALRSDGILDLAGGMLTITDLTALQRLSDI